MEPMQILKDLQISCQSTRNYNEFERKLKSQDRFNYILTMNKKVKREIHFSLLMMTSSNRKDLALPYPSRFKKINKSFHKKGLKKTVFLVNN